MAPPLVAVTEQVQLGKLVLSPGDDVALVPSEQLDVSEALSTTAVIEDPVGRRVGDEHVEAFGDSEPDLSEAVAAERKCLRALEQAAVGCVRRAVEGERAAVARLQSDGGVVEHVDGGIYRREKSGDQLCGTGLPAIEEQLVVAHADDLVARRQL